MQGLLPADLLLRRSHADEPMLWVSRPAVQARKVQHAAPEGDELVFGDGAVVRGVVGRVGVIPVRGGEDAR